jgi:translation elongation factor EF-Ts
LGRQIAQHIVGMNPTEIGEENETKIESKGVEGEGEGEESRFDESEKRLLYQEFLMKPKCSVGEFLKENHIKVVDFVRFECGESLVDKNE